MISLRSSLVLLALVLHAAPGLAAPRTSYDLEVEQRRERFQRDVRGPGAVVPLLGLLDLWELVEGEGRQQIAALAEEAAKDPRALPDVRARARWVLRGVRYHQGRRDEARRLTEELGIVTRFGLAGPFDNEGGRGHGTAYPPEQETRVAAADTVYEGKSRAVPVRWRRLPSGAVSEDGVVVLDATVRPESFATTYAAAYVKNPGTTPLRIALRLGATGAVKVFVNRGPAVLDRDVYRPLHLDQEAAAATLLPGWNRVLVKISSRESAYAFLLRLTAPDGQPLPAGVATTDEPPAPGWSIPPAPRTAQPAPSSIVRGLRAARAARKGAARTEALLDLGLYLHHVVAYDPDEHEDQALLQQVVAAAPTVRNHLLLALATAEVNERRRTLEAGRALPPAPDGAPEAKERARLLLDLGRLYQEGRRDLLAEDAWREALRLDPELYTAAVELADLQAARGMGSVALELLLPWLGRHHALRLQKGAAQLCARLGREPEAERRYAEVLKQEPEDLEAMRHLLDRARARGQADEALKWLDRIQAARPAQYYLARERVELLEGAGRTAAALAALDAALAGLPDEPDLLQRRGRLLLRLERKEEALAAYRRSLELRPQNPELRAYLARIDEGARSAADLVRNFRAPVPDLVEKARARQSKEPRVGAGTPARVLLDQAVTRVHDNGLSEVFTQRVVEILDERGVREYGDYEIRYTPDTQSVEIKAARVYKADGEVHEIASHGERSVSEPWYGLYYDVRAMTVRFDGLRPGDVLDVEYVVADVGRRNLLSDYFGDLHFLQEEVPRRESRYLLLVPEHKGRRFPLYFNHLDRFSGTVRIAASERATAGGQRLYSFVAREVPKIETEPGMPGYTQVAAYVHVSTYKSWEDVAAWYTGLVRAQLVPSPEISRAARAAVAGLRDERQKVRAIYDLVVKRTRYVGLEFGIHGYKPYKVAQVFARKFGDCKDKAALLVTLLKEAGIESTLVLARTRRNGAIDPEPASLSIFDHAIVYVPRFDLFLDGTAEFSGSDELPAEDQDIDVLLVSDPRPPYLGRGHLVRTPVLPPEANTVARQLDAQLRADGGARVREQMSVSGQVAAKWREHYQSKSAQRERYEKSWNEQSPSARVVHVELPGLLDLERPVRLAGEVEVPTWGRPAGARAEGPELGRLPGGGDLVLRPLGRDPDLLRSYARLSQRRYDLILGFPWRNLEKVTLRLPPGMAVKRLPESRQLRSPFGTFDMRVTRGAREIGVEAELIVNRHLIKSDEYPAFRSFCAEVDSLVAQDLVVGHD